MGGHCMIALETHRFYWIGLNKMNKKSIDAAKDEALRGSAAAMKRAATKAREIAEATGTPLVVNRDGKTVLIEPSELNSAQEGSANDESSNS